MQYTYINGEFCPSQDTCLSPADRGFRYGDGVFETIRVEEGVACHLEWHLARLARGLSAIRITYEAADLSAVVQELIARNLVEQGGIRIAVSRGVGGRGYLPQSDMVPTIIVESFALPPFPDGPQDLWISAYRKIPDICLPAGIKHAQGLQSTLARMEAADHDCFEALLFNMDLLVCEGSSSHLFFLKDETLHTPSLDCGILEGATRARLLRVSPWPVMKGYYNETDLRGAEAVVMVNTMWQAVPIRRLLPMDAGWKSESLAARLNELLAADRKAYIHAKST